MNIVILSQDEYWPDVESEEYGRVAEVAIGLITGMGYEGTEALDVAGNKVSEELQTELMDVMFRAPRLVELFDRLESIMSYAIISQLDDNRIKPPN